MKRYSDSFEETAANCFAFGSEGYDMLDVLVPEAVLQVDCDHRVLEKNSARLDDLGRLDMGNITEAELAAENGFFSSLDRSRARLLVRRAHIQI